MYELAEAEQGGGRNGARGRGRDMRDDGWGGEMHDVVRVVERAGREEVRGRVRQSKKARERMTRGGVAATCATMAGRWGGARRSAGR